MSTNYMCSEDLNESFVSHQSADVSYPGEVHSDGLLEIEKFSFTLGTKLKHTHKEAVHM